VARLSHIALNVSAQQRSRDFYLAVLGPLGFALADEVPGAYARISNGRDTVIVLSQVEPNFAERAYHRRGVGLHHFALAAESREAVDAIALHLAELDIPLAGAGLIEIGYRGDYYCLLFEDPDRILIEIV